MMAMAMMTMPKKTMAKMTMAKPVVPVMAVASAEPAVTVTSSESLTGDGQRSGGSTPAQRSRR